MPARRVTRSSATDTTLMRRVQGGDVAAFALLYDRHAPLVLGLTQRMLGERGLAEDVAQEAFVALWRNRAAYSPARGAVGTWLLAIARNRAIDAIRRRRPVQPLVEDGPEPEAPERTEEAVLERLEAAAIRIALAVLPDGQRLVLELAYFGGLSQSEIAAREHLPLGTVKSRLRLALRRLAAELAPPAAVPA
jgi:RNA polymerase sigma-70 factor (ECF subfamily)